MVPRKLKNQFVLLGILLTWSVGGLIGFVGYRQMVTAVRREAMARVENAVRVGQRVLETEFIHLDPGGRLPPEARLLRRPAEAAHSDDPPAALIRKARVEGKAEGFALLPDGLSMAMDNLIGNAVKYGEKGTEILVAVTATPGALRVAVTNRGVGVAPERMPELFAKFHRIQDPQLRSRKGTGVGLYLVRRIVELHGGQVGVEGAYGQWIRFWFEVPPAAAPAAALGGKPA